jgi:hypothetical protein
LRPSRGAFGNALMADLRRLVYIAAQAARLNAPAQS